MLKDLEKRVKPKQLGLTVQGIRESHFKDLLVELKCSAENRERLNSAFYEVVGASGSVRHLIPMIELEVSGIGPRMQIDNVGEAVKGFFEHRATLDMKLSLTNRPGVQILALL